MNNQESIKFTKLFALLFFLEGAVALFSFTQFPSEAGNRFLFNLSEVRLAIAFFVFIILCLTLFLFLNLHILTRWVKQILEKINILLVTKSQLSKVQTIIIFLAIFLIELFFLTFISLPPFMRPLLIWTILACLQTWLLLRLTYKEVYRERPSLRSKIRFHWRAFTTTQRQTFWILAGIGLLYFCTFIPLNALGWNGSRQTFVSGIDENIQYPIAVETITSGNDFASTVYHVMVNEDDVYGHPYVTLESLVLLPSRIIYGADFGDHYQINLLLLRQFMCVLPMVLAMFLLVFMLTRFRSLIQSLGLYLLLLTIPGTVKFNIRFLHPDALILLLIILTIFFLQQDRFRFKKYFYLAAVTCALAAVIKLWGFFFFLAIVFYLIAGLVKKFLTVKTMILAGFGFVLIMGATAFISDPELLIPSVAKELTSAIQGQISNRSVRYDESGDNTIYQKDFPTWMKFFEEYYIQEYFFFFCFACLALCSLWGKRKLTAQMLLCWCLVVAIYMIYFLAAKSYWYMMELMVPLYVSPFLLPSLINAHESGIQSRLLKEPYNGIILWTIVAVVCASQFVFNILLIVNSPFILNYARIA